VLQPVLAVAFGIWMVILARSKGYNPWLWFCAAGLLGLIVLAVLPDLTKEGLNEEEKSAKKKTGDILGAVVSALAVLLGIVLAFVALGR
jgi:hypothetical protein